LDALSSLLPISRRRFAEFEALLAVFDALLIAVAMLFATFAVRENLPFFPEALLLSTTELAGAFVAVVEPVG
jgi:hypothetical protein